MSNLKSEYFECDCCHPMHILRISYFEDEWDKEYNTDGEFYVSVILNDTIWYKRIWYALKYIFGISPSKYYYGDIVWSKDTAVKLKNFIEKIADRPQEDQH
jgi:hypothetical protein